jgi:Zn-dependent protease
LDDRTLASIIVVAIMLLVGFPVHEFAHALAAYRLGDSTAKLMGRLTLNPIAHFDPLGGILLAVTFIGTSFGFGWAKPTPVNPSNLEGGHRGEAIVAAAGPLSNLILAIAAALPLRYLVANPDLALQIPGIALDVLNLFILINIVLMIFNLLPIPPLDGFGVLESLLPRRLAPLAFALRRYGMLILIAVMMTGMLGRLLGPAQRAILELLLGRHP